MWSQQRYIDAPILRDQNTDADGLCDDQRLDYLGDANFNVTTLVDTGGDGLKRYVYSPYGKLTIYDATWSNTRSTSSYANAYTYTGRYLDAETGLYYYRHRMYHAGVGSFCSRDPIQADINLYRYVRNNPVLLVDPSGMFYREVTCTFDNGSHIWSETVAADTSETAGQACQRRATGWGWGTAWTVIGAREGGQHKDHGGTYESDFADLRVTCAYCKNDRTAAEKDCKDKIALRAASLALGRNITGFGEGLIGTAAGGAGGIMIAAGTCPPAGVALLVGGIVVAGKGVYDFYVTTEIAGAARAAAKRYCDCNAIIQ